MTDYSALAEQIVALGVGEHYDFHDGDFHYTHLMPPVAHEAHTFCHDWGVAGAMMEKLLHELGNRRLQITMTDRVIKDFAVNVTWYYGSNDARRIGAHNDSLPLAINLACVEALTE